MTNKKAVEEIKKIEEGNRIESNYVPMEVEVEGEIKGNIRKKETITVERNVWTEAIEEYHRSYEGWSITQEETEKIRKEVENKVKTAVVKVKKRMEAREKRMALQRIEGEKERTAKRTKKNEKS